MSSESPILIVCAGLENARNGVGDFASTLAATLSLQGRPSAVVSVRDTFSDLPHPPTDSRLSELRQTHAGPARLLRLGLGHPDAWTSAGDFAREIGADWVSLQFVCWGFHPKGLCQALPEDFERFARAAKRNFRTHVFLHELECGRRPQDPWREKLLGWLQRVANSRALRRLNPSAVHTSTSDYAGASAREYGLKAGVLAIPSALPTAVPDAGERAGLAVALESNSPPDKLLVAGLFGSVYRSWDPATALESLRLTAAAHGLRPAVCHVGRTGPEVARLGDLCASVGVAFHAAGPLPAEKAASLLAACDLGMSPMPPDAVGKSSALAALLAQGLPVIVTRPFSGGFGSDPAFPLTERLWFVDEAKPAILPWPFPAPGAFAWLPEFAKRLAASLPPPAVNIR